MIFFLNLILGRFFNVSIHFILFLCVTVECGVCTSL